MQSAREAIEQIRGRVRIPATTGNRCPACNRALIFHEGREFCFQCEVIAKEDAELAKAAIADRERMKLKQLEKQFAAHSFINPSLKEATFAKYNPPTESLYKAKAAVMGFVMNFDKEKPQNLLLAGSYGTGKSHLARAATIELMQQGYSCMFISVPKLFAKIQESFNKNSSFSESQFISYLQSVDLLVIDDLGTEHYGKDTDGESWGHTKLFEILDGRAGRHTIYTTNLVEEALEDKVNGRNFSRILDNTEIIYMVGPDFRRKRK